jgi:pyrimidine-nucleoside phosphorylase
MSPQTGFHIVDLIRKQRDGEPLTTEETGFLVRGAAAGTIPPEQLSAWLMAVYLRSMSPAELHALTIAMRDSGEVLARGATPRVDKHSTGGVGDKTSFLVAPIAAAAGLVVPMISGRALGHGGGTLDKLESIPGYRTELSSAEMDRVLAACGLSIVGQSPALVPADRVLYALRDRTSTIESPNLICASIMSKKLAEGLDALVLDVKTGSGAFMRRVEDAQFLAALMVDTGERAGTRTTALVTDMNQPLGRGAGNWIEIEEAVEVLRGGRDPLSEDLRAVSLTLAGWMLFLGGKAESAEAGAAFAETLIANGAAFDCFARMVAAQGGEAGVLTRPFHAPGATREFLSPQSGYITAMDCTAVGWAVQRLGAGRERAGEPVDPHAGIRMHAKLGSFIEAGQPLCSLYAAEQGRFAEPESLLRRAIHFADAPAPAPALVKQVITAENRLESIKGFAQSLDRP